MDPFVTLTAAAVATKTLKIGTGVCLIARRDPIQTAKLVASIDQISGRRFLLGVGGGGNQEEIENHGTAFASRHKRNDGGAETDLDPGSRRVPRRIRHRRSDHVVDETIAKAASAGVGRRRVPIFRALGCTGGHRDIVDLIPRFPQMTAEAGRDPLPITAWYAARDLSLPRRHHDPGVERAVFTVPSAAADVVLPTLDEIGALMRAVNG